MSEPHVSFSLAPITAEADSSEAASDDEPSPDADACQSIAAKIEALMLKQQDYQRSLYALAEEQATFLSDMRAFADAHQACRFPGERVSGRSCGVDVPSHGSEGAKYVSEASAITCETNESRGAGRCSTLRKTMVTAHLKSRLSSLYQDMQSSVLMQSSSATWVARARSAAARLQRWAYFEPAMGLVIFANSVNIGWTIERELQDQDTTVQAIIEIVILGLFWAELVLLFFVHGPKCVKNLWNLFDLVLNSTTTAVLVFAALLGKHAEEGSASALSDVVKQMLILRVLRLLRLFRAGRVIKMSRSLWKLIIGLQNCLSTMVAALSLISICLYLFACLGAELISKALADDPVVGALIARSFSSLPRIMLTLFQFITMDSTADIYVTLIHRSPLLFLYFLLVVVLVTLMLMNLITAIVVEDAITTASMDQEMKKHNMREKIRVLRPAFVKLFKRLDHDGGGAIHVEQIISAVNDKIHIPMQIQDLVTPERMLDLFDLLDNSGKGELTEDEFVEGLSCLALSEVPMETVQMLHLLRSTHSKVERLKSSMAAQYGWSREAASAIESAALMRPRGSGSGVWFEGSVHGGSPADSEGRDADDEDSESVGALFTDGAFADGAQARLQRHRISESL